MPDLSLISQKPTPADSADKIVTAPGVYVPAQEIAALAAAETTSYSNSGTAAVNVQDALDELYASGGGGGSYTGAAGQISITGMVIGIDSGYVGQSSITTLGNVTTGTWNATAISAVKGGTGQTTYALGDILYASTTTALSRLSAGTDGYVLTLAGGVPTWAAGGGGGGGLTGFTASLETASPNNTVNASVLLASGGSTDQDAVLQPKGNGAILGQLPTGSSAGGNKRGISSVDLQLSRSNAGAVASGNYAFLTGYDSTASGVYAIAMGQACTSNGPNSVTIGKSSNASGTVAIAMGESAIANSFASIAMGSNSYSSGSYSIAIGQGATSTANGSVAIGYATEAISARAFACGYTTQASGNYSFASGAYSLTRGLQGARAHSSENFASAGAGGNQRRDGTLGVTTTSATPAILVADNNSAGATNQINLPDNACYFLEGKVVARQQATGDYAVWKVSAVVTRDSGAGTTTVRGTPTITSIQQAAGLSGVSLAITADTSNGCIAVTATGQTSKTIKWGMAWDTQEVVF